MSNLDKIPLKHAKRFEEPKDEYGAPIGWWLCLVMLLLAFSAKGCSDPEPKVTQVDQMIIDEVKK